jgi:hypothetical protein
VWLAWDYWAFRGENAVASGWLQRARRLLEKEPACAERTWLELREAALALFEDGDSDPRPPTGRRRNAIAQAVRNVDLEMLGRAVQGLALVSSGAIAEGCAPSTESTRPSSPASCTIWW